MEKEFVINGELVKVQNFKLAPELVSFELAGKAYHFSLIKRDGTDLILDDGSRFKSSISSPNREGESMVMARGREALISGSGKKMKKAGAHAGSLTSPMPGKIFKILKDVGSEIKKGEAILILEAMKMEHSIRADKDGKVKRIPFKVGELVQGGVVLAEVE